MGKITKEQLDNITNWLIVNIFRNDDVMWCGPDTNTPEFEDTYYDLIDIIASLHNLLYEVITYERYDYMWHWANKIGSCCNDKFLDDIMNKNQEGESKCQS